MRAGEAAPDDATVHNLDGPVATMAESSRRSSARRRTRPGASPRPTTCCPSRPRWTRRRSSRWSAARPPARSRTAWRRRSPASERPSPERARDELHRERGGRVLAVEDRVDLDDLEARACRTRRRAPSPGAPRGTSARRSPASRRRAPRSGRGRPCPATRARTRRPARFERARHDARDPAPVDARSSCSPRRPSSPIRSRSPGSSSRTPITATRPASARAAARPSYRSRARRGRARRPTACRARCRSVSSPAC